MASTSDEILGVLKELKESKPEIQACMAAKKGLEGIVMFPQDFKETVTGIWDPLEKTVDQILHIISEKSVYKLERIYIEILDYSIIFYPLSASDTALILFIPNRKDFDVNNFISENNMVLANARDSIIKIIEK